MCGCACLAVRVCARTGVCMHAASVGGSRDHECVESAVCYLRMRNSCQPPVPMPNQSPPSCFRPPCAQVLRYVGVVDTATKEAKVELRRYPKSHAFSQLTGSDNIILFSTSRYMKQPLIIRGPGAGAEVTAGGVFSDLLRLCTCVVSPM